MNLRTITGYIAVGALMLALPLSAAVSSTIGATGSLVTASAVASLIMPETSTESLEQVSAVDPIPEQASKTQGQVPGAETLFEADWGAAHPAVYARIALAFDTEAMNGADLMGVQCRMSLCRVTFEADRDIPVRKLLPMQLAESFHAMVTVHAGGSDHVYLDVP